MSAVNRRLALVLVLCLSAVPALWSQQPQTQSIPQLSEEEIRNFLLTAKVVSAKPLSKGITAPIKLTLTDGKMTHDAVFQAVDERKPVMQFSTGRTEMNFRDSWHFNVAAYELAKMVGLDYMMPVYVERKYAGKTGAVGWWVTWKWDEEMRLKEKIQPPDPDDWNKQMFRMRVFAQLAYDTDRNLGNVLITEDWKLKMIDFTRAFRLHNDLENPKNLTRFDRQLLERLKTLNEAECEAKLKPHLGKGEIRAILARRDKILQLAEKLVKEKGEAEVLY